MHIVPKDIVNILDNPCLQNNGGCEDECIFENFEKMCTCGEGFELESDGISCIDIDECMGDPEVCDQICTNNVGSFECSCLQGYMKDGNYCKVIGDSAKLVFANRIDIREFALDENEYEILGTGKSIIGVDFDIETDQLYYSDIVNPKLCQKPMHGANNSGDTCDAIVNRHITTPDGLAVDWIHHNIYWTDTGYDEISIMSLSTEQKYRKTLICDGLDEPRAVAVDPRDGQRWLYWTDWGETPKIERSGLDGSNRMVLINNSNTNIDWPNGVTIGESQIACINL